MRIDFVEFLCTEKSIQTFNEFGFLKFNIKWCSQSSSKNNSNNLNICKPMQYSSKMFYQHCQFFKNIILIS